MGPDAMSVVDERLRVRAYENPRVADVSLISEGGFTLQATTQ
jgi:choline dehydrogenase-like flavoprotein